MFKKRTVADIVAPIQRIVDDLHTHAGTHEKKAERHSDLVSRHAVLAQDAAGEAKEAKATASKIASLISAA